MRKVWGNNVSTSAVYSIKKHTEALLQLIACSPDGLKKVRYYIKTAATAATGPIFSLGLRVATFYKNSGNRQVLAATERQPSGNSQFSFKTLLYNKTAAT